MDNSDLLEKYVDLYNYGVKSADFGPVLRLFADDAVLEHEDASIGIFKGVDNIADGLSYRLPYLNLSIFNIKENQTSAVADYGDEIAPITRLGGIVLQSNGGKIRRLIIKK
jgi:hypothetical protein